MTQTAPKIMPQQTYSKLQGIPVRSHLRAGIVLQVDIPAVTAVQQAAQTPVPTTATTTA